MTPEKIKVVATMYQLEIKNKHLITHEGIDRLSHINEMIPKLITIVDEGRIEKAFRWLGFIQGVLWCAGIYTIEELKRHNMPGFDVFDPKH